MKTLLKKISAWPYYSVLIPLLPVASLSYMNWTLLNPWNLIRPVIVLVATSLILTGIFSVFFRDLHRSAFMSTLVLVLFFFYWDLSRLVFNIGLEKEIWTQSILSLLIVLFSLLLWKKKEKWAKATGHLNFAGLLTLLFMLGMGFYYFYSIQGFDLPSIGGDAIEPVEAEAYPDIYYFILDGYGRQDVLKDLYRFDNSPFIDKLKSMGFMIPEKSKSNFNQTILSLCASLNLNNLEKAIAALPKKNYDRRPLINALSKNRLFSFLHEKGYRIVTYDSGYGSTELHSGDEFISDWRHLTTFESYLLARTPLARVSNYWAYWSHAERIKKSFNAAATVGEGKNKPVFYFAHIVCPHPPFILDRHGQTHIPKNVIFNFFDGNHLVRNQNMLKYYRNGYLHQLSYMNSQIIPLMEKLIANSREKKQPLAIVLQGDHGPGAFLHQDSLEMTNQKERFSILNAYYLDGGRKEIPEDVTPANSFRILLNHFFKLDLPMIEDRSFFVKWFTPYQLQPVLEKMSAEVNE
jgi:hypothetical protein